MNSMSVHRLMLANGHIWQFIVNERTHSWHDQFFSIMQLKESELNNSTKIIIINNKTIQDFIKESPLNLPMDNWTATKLKLMTIWTHHYAQDIICETNGLDDKLSNVARFFSTLYPIYKRMIYSDGFPFHAALVELDGKGILLAAESATGKSTCCQRIPLPWKPLCDDETLIVKDDIGRYVVHPFPTWKNYLTGMGQQSWDVQYHLPISAIFFLKQAQSDQVLPIGKGKAVTSICNSVLEICDRYRMWLSEEEMKNICTEIFHNACELSNAVPSYSLHISLSGHFWEEIEKVIQ